MKKTVLFTLLSGFCLSLLFITRVKALYVQPQSGTFAPGSEVTVTVKTNSGLAANTGAMQLRLDIANATVTQGLQSTDCDPINGGRYFCIGVCDAATPIGYTNNSICIDFAAAGENSSIASDSVLGFFKIRLSSTPGQVATVTAGSGNGYFVGNTLSPVTGVLGSYTIQSGTNPSPTPLPITGIEDYPVLVMLAGIAIIFLGVGFFIYRDKTQRITN